MRVFVFDGKDAADAAYITASNRTGQVIPPIPVNPVAGAALPTCASTSTTCEPLAIKAYVNGFPTSVPAQLIEYTFAAAQGPPLNPVLSIDTQHRQLQHLGGGSGLPAGRDRGAAATRRPRTPIWAPPRTWSRSAPRSPRSPPTATCGRSMSRPISRRPHPTIPLTVTAPGRPALSPAAAALDRHGLRRIVPRPAAGTAGAVVGHAGRASASPGQVAQGTLDLWTKCTSATPPQSPTCTKIQAGQTPSSPAHFRQCFPGQPLPEHASITCRCVYGWVQFPGCATPLVKVAGYDATIGTYCDLQYNFFDPDRAAPATSSIPMSS